METHYIYELLCPLSLTPKYIGKTKNILFRFKSHQSPKNKSKLTRKEAWVKSLKSQGLEPIIQVIHECSSDDTNFWESHYISLYRSWGFDLKNMTNGGDGNSNMTNETKERMKGKRPIITGSNNHFYGKKHKQESIDKMRKPRYDGFSIKCSETLKEVIKNNPSLGYQKGTSNPSSRSVICFNMQNEIVKTYACIVDVVVDGFSVDCVSKCARGVNKSHKGFLFTYSN